MHPYIIRIRRRHMAFSKGPEPMDSPKVASKVNKAKHPVSSKPTSLKAAPGEETNDSGSVRKSKDYKSLMGNLKLRAPKLKM